MKKFLSLILSSLLISVCLFSFTACGGNAPKGSVSIKYYADGGQIVSAILSGEESIGLVPEPACSNLIKKVQAQGKTLYKLDLQELYDKDLKSYPQAVLMVKESFLNTYPNFVSAISSEVSSSVSWTKDSTENAVNAIKSKLEVSSLNANALSTTAIDGCNIYFEDATTSTSAVKEYVSKLIELNANSAKAVGDDFFYDGNANGTFNKKQITLYAPDGAPAISLAKSIYDNSNFGTNIPVAFNIIATQLVSSQLVPAYRSGTADVVILPINLATKFYNTDGNITDNYKMAGVITHGNFYIVSTTEITITDLKDKRVAVPQQNAVPDWTFKIVLDKYNLSGINIEA